MIVTCGCGLYGGKVGLGVVGGGGGGRVGGFVTGGRYAIVGLGVGRGVVVVRLVVVVVL